MEKNAVDLIHDHDEKMLTEAVEQAPDKKKLIIILSVIVAFIMVLCILGIVLYMRFQKTTNDFATESNDASSGSHLSQKTSDDSRAKYYDVFYRSLIRTFIPEAQIYYGSNNRNFENFTIRQESFDEYSCDKMPIVNVSSDGQSIAIFGKLCSDPEKYVCVDAKQDIKTGMSISNNELLVDKIYAEGGYFSCESGKSAPVSVNERKDEKIDNEILDATIKTGIAFVSIDLMNYMSDYGTYGGFVEESLLNYSIDEGGCTSDLVIDIAPSGNEYVIHQQLCSDPSKSFCEENVDRQIKIVDTSVVQDTYHCL